MKEMLSFNKKYVYIFILLIMFLIGYLIINNKREYVIKFDSDGGTAVESIKAKEGWIDLPTDVVKDSYIFDGWIDKDSGNKVANTYYLEKDVTLVALWVEESVKRYSITFYWNDEENTIKTELHSEGIIELPGNLEREGYLFNGWLLDGELVTEKFYLHEDVILRADWIKEEDKTYEVSFKLNDGQGNDYVVNVVENGSLSKPTDPVRDGYKFLGWYYNDKLYDFDTVVTADMTLVAKWEKVESTAKSYTVTFNLNGGSGSIEKQMIKEGSTVIKPSNPTRSNYKFLGWYTSTKEEYQFNKKVSADLELYALWAPIISYNKSNSGKWIFVNNPEMLDRTSYLADANYGGVSLYKDQFKGNCEIYYEHGIDTSIVKYYAIRLYNSNSTSVTLSINKCGSSTGEDPAKIANSYYSGSCSVAGTYIMPAKSTLYIYHNGSEYVVGGTEAISKVNKLSSGYIEGMIYLTSSNTLYMSAIAFQDVNNTSYATYSGNYADNSANGGTNTRVYSGYYNTLPILTNNLTVPIYDQTPSGEIPIAYLANNGEEIIKNSWTTNVNGGLINTSTTPYSVIYYPEEFTSDFINLVVPTSFNTSTNQVTSSFTMGPYKSYFETRSYAHPSGGTIYGWNYNWANWGVHYKEKITIANYSSSKKTVSFYVSYSKNKNKVAVYYNGAVRIIGQTNPNQIWKVTIPANSTKTMEAEVTLMGNSSRGITKYFVLE